MINKYYTPEPEEFHIGFEYEEELVFVDEYCIDSAEKLIKITKQVFNDRLIVGVSKTHIIKKWVFKIYKLKDSIDNTRVKYLDTEDIESFGFKIEQLPDDFDYKIVNQRGTTIGTFLKTLKLEPNIQLHNIWFTIKNKSELKVLLKQLEII